jgi:hypothetical protein
MEFKKVDFNLLKGEENSNYRKEIIKKVLDSKVVQQFMKEIILMKVLLMLI